MQRLSDRAMSPPMAGKITDPQVAQRSTWTSVPDRDTAAAAMHIIHATPANASTVTELNPLDPGTVADGQTGDTYLGWLQRPGVIGPTVPGRLGPEPR